MCEESHTRMYLRVNLQLSNTVIQIQMHYTKRVRTLKSLDELLVLRGNVARRARALHGDVEHRLALHLPARVRQWGEEAVQLRVELVANRVGPVALLEEERRKHWLHQTQQVLHLVARDRAVLHHPVEVLGRQPRRRFSSLLSLSCSCTKPDAEL